MNRTAPSRSRDNTKFASDVCGCASSSSTGWLANRAFIATDEFTIADILMTHVLSVGSTDQTLVKRLSHVRDYLDRCMARPVWKRAIDGYCARVEPA